jgi:hypothetical protein
LDESQVQDRGAAVRIATKLHICGHKNSVNHSVYLSFGGRPWTFLEVGMVPAEGTAHVQILSLKLGIDSEAKPLAERAGGILSLGIDPGIPPSRTGDAG